jgi:hypothetical protein
MPKLVRTNSGVLEVKQHPELPLGARIRLRPLISLAGDGTISAIEVSGRTPSPFGRAMGDHTVAWQALVDAAHANLWGLPVDAAITWLRNTQQAVGHWMLVAGTQGMLLLRDLDDDIPGRRARLEDAAWRVEDHLRKAKEHLDASGAQQAAPSLAKALACHLAFLNYLPFATVEARSARGSHGSAEGWLRQLLVGWEIGRRKARADEEQARKDAKVATAAEQQAEADRQAQVARDVETLRAAREPTLRNTLWGLFDFAAAMRGANLEYVLNPGVATSVSAVVAQLNQLTADIKALAASLDPGTGMLTGAQRGQLEGIRDTARAVGTAPGYASIQDAAGLVRDGAAAFLDGQAEQQVRTKKRHANSAGDNLKLNAALTAAKETADTVTTAVAAAPERAARVLTATLLKHLRSVSAAYPDSVTDSGFLQPDAGTAAEVALRAAVARDYGTQLALPGAPEAAEKLYAAVSAAIRPAGVAIAASNAWVVAAGREPLVVTWDGGAAAGARLSINGRAGAPPGVAGMGSHTTAWVIECLALQRLLRDADTADVITSLQDAARDDLAGQVITLDRYLPADQVEGGQVALIFEAAADLFEATDPGEAARAFLRFRNLLPFATVDAGSRSGHGEDVNASEEASYDGKSLREAADLIEAALTDEAERDRMAKALAGTVSGLIDTSWPQHVLAAARKSKTRLSARAKALSDLSLDSSKQRDEKIKNDAAVTAATIRKLRREEHQRVYKAAHEP